MNWSDLISYLTGFCESIIAFYLFGNLLKPRFHFKKTWPALLMPIVGYSILIWVISSWNPIFKLALFAVFLLVVNLLYFKGHFLILCFFTLLLQYELIMTDMLLGNLFAILLSNEASGIFNANLFITAAAKLVNLLFAWIIVKVFRPLDFNIPKKYWLFLNVITLTFIVIAVCFIMIYPSLEIDIGKSSSFFILSLCFFLVSCLVFYFFTVICQFFQNERHYYITQLTNSALQQQIMLQESMTESTKKFRHDIKNNLMNISYLLAEEKYEDSKKYVDELCSQFEQINAICNSGNSVIDAIISCKAIAAEKNNIRLDLDIQKLPSLQISYTDLASILSNLLDNAIEASQSLNDDEDKKISIRIFPFKSYVNIILKNNYQHTLQTFNDAFITTKEDKSLHGYGLKSIQEAVGRNGGHFNCTAEDNEFTANVLLSIK